MAAPSPPGRSPKPVAEVLQQRADEAEKWRWEDDGGFIPDPEARAVGRLLRTLRLVTKRAA